MARRQFRGRSFSENGWPYVDQGSCTWIRVPGCEVWLQIQNGAPLQILRAFAADYNAYVEPLRDDDSACWTQDNSVDTSNHPGGTSMDLNWQGPNRSAFRLGIPKERAFPGGMARALDDLYAFYEGLVFCGGNWSIRDWMHHQLAAGTYDQKNDRPQPKVDQFIARKIRADGFSTYKRGGSGGHLPLDKKDGYAMAAITVGRELNITPKGQKIAICTQLVETNRTMYANRNVPASLGFPHDAVGADHDSTGLYQQRQAWGPLSETMDPIKSSRLFYLGGHAGQRGLTDFDYNSNARTPGGWAQAVQVSAFPTRYDERFPEAEQIYNRLANYQTAPADPFEELLMADPVESWSIYATPGEPKIPPINLLRAIDAKNHRDLTDEDAKAGDFAAIERVVRTARGQGANRSPGAVAHAARVLSEIEAANPEILLQYLRGAANG